MNEATKKAIAQAWRAQWGPDWFTPQVLAWVESVLAPILTAELQAENERLRRELDDARAGDVWALVAAQDEVERLRTALTEARAEARRWEATATDMKLRNERSAAAPVSETEGK